MANKELYRVSIGRKVRSVDVSDHSLRLDFGDGNVLDIYSYHNQDCCETVYADFSIVEYYKENILAYGTVRRVTIKAVSDMGFLLCLESDEYDPAIKIFIACYEFQNGYYSDNLYLEIEYKNSIKTVDISGLVESHIE